MNERIKEIAIEAGIISAEYNGFDPTGLTTAQRKFAELIIQECIDIVSPYAVRMENFDGGHPIADLKKHFGVGE